MMIAAGITLGALLGFAVAGRWIARRLPPAAAAIFLVAGSLVTGGSMVLVLAVLAATWLGTSPIIARLVPWSAAGARALNPVPAAIGQLSVGLVLLIGVYGTARSIRKLKGVVGVLRGAGERVIASPGQLNSIVDDSSAVDDSSGVPGRVIVIDDAAVDAFSTPFPSGRIFVTTGLVNAVTPAELRVILLHELAHVRYGHGWLRLVAELVGCYVGFLGPIAGEVDLLTERWADEYAARKCGDRRSVASAVARVGLLRPANADGRRPRTGRMVAGVARASGGDVVTRVRSMLSPAVALSPRVGIAALALLVAAGVSGLTVAGAGEDLFEDAMPPLVHGPVAPASSPAPATTGR